MEKKIILVGVRKITSKKNNQDYYMVDYIEKNQNLYIPNTDIISIEEYNKIASKMKGNLIEVVGIFSINAYKRAYLSDIK